MSTDRWSIRGRSPLAATVFAATLALVLLAAPAARAAAPLEGSGTGAITSLVDGDARPAGDSGNILRTRTLTGMVSGDLTGTVAQTVTGMVRPSSNQVTFHGTMTFTGTVDGCGDDRHTITLRFSGRGQANPPVTSSTVRVVGDPGGTLDISGQGTIEQNGLQLTYDLQYVCR